MAQGQPNRNRGGREAEEMRFARRQARHSVRIALRRCTDYHEEGALITPAAVAQLAMIMQRAEHHLSTMEDYYG